jgi:hypothetical protein
LSDAFRRPQSVRRTCANHACAAEAPVDLCAASLADPESAILQQQFWSSPPQATSASAKALSLAVHRLRQTFAGRPLGTEVVKAVYGKGYCLDCPVEAVLPPESAPRPSCVEQMPVAPGLPLASGVNLVQFYNSEAHNYWPGRDPCDLEHRL